MQHTLVTFVTITVKLRCQNCSHIKTFHLWHSLNYNCPINVLSASLFKLYPNCLIYEFIH